MKTPSIVFSVVAISFATFGWPHVTHAAGFMYFKDSPIVGDGEDVDLLVAIDTGTGGPLGGYNIRFDSFDEKVLPQAAVDIAFGGAAVTTTISPGSIEYSTSGNATLSSGAYFQVTLKAVAPGESTITLTGFDVFDLQSPPQPYPPQVTSPITLTLTIVPEPAALNLVGLGASLAWLPRRRRRISEIR